MKHDKLEALAQCIPLPRHVLPVSQYGSVIRIRDPDRHQNLIICSLVQCQPSRKFHANPFGNFCAKLLTDRQTDKQRQLHIFLGGGNYTTFSSTVFYRHIPGWAGFPKAVKESHCSEFLYRPSALPVS